MGIFTSSDNRGCRGRNDFSKQTGRLYKIRRSFGWKRAAAAGIRAAVLVTSGPAIKALRVDRGDLVDLGVRDDLHLSDHTGNMHDQGGLIDLLRSQRLGG